MRLEMNGDGVPIFKSPPLGFWTILFRVIDSVDPDPFLVSADCGSGKPENVFDYLQPALDDIKLLERDGINHNGIHYIVRLERAVCDAPARSFIKQITSHCGYGACERCDQKGKSVKGRMTFPKIREVNLRDNHTFRNQNDPRHHTGNSPFLQLTSFDMVFGFPLDYLHLVLLGVMKKLLKIWILSLKRSPHRISDTQQARIDRMLRRIRNSLPSEMDRRSRSIAEIRTWKAVEFRTFLLYTGIRNEPFIV